MNYSEKWGSSVEEAVKLALSDLKVSIDEVDVTVLEEPTKGFFGIGNKLAKVRVEIKKKEEKEKPPLEKIDAAEYTEYKADKEEKKEIKKEESVEEEKVLDKSHKKEERILGLDEKPENLVALTDHPGLSFLRDTIENMGIKVEANATGNEEFVFIEMTGEDTGTMIGKRGQTLDAIQYLTSLVVNKGREKYVKVVVDAENYRAKRERTLSQLANRLADKAAKSKRSVKLEPMNPYERKVIHSSLQNHPKVTTRSEGEEPYRRVIIELKK